MARKRKEESIEKIKLKQPDRSGPTDKTLLELADERNLFAQAERRQNELKSSNDDEDDEDDEEEGRLSPRAERILETLLWTVCLSMLHFTLDTLVHHQSEFVRVDMRNWIADSSRCFPVFSPLVYTLHPHASNPNILPGLPSRYQSILRQIIFFVTSFSGFGRSRPAAPAEPSLAAREVPSGSIIYHCTVPGTVALTFDDGPFKYTSQLLDLLEANGARATFFINGDNWSHEIDNPATGWPDILRRIFNNHQLASHTWSHQDLTLLDLDGQTFQMKQLETAINNVVGRVPTYMRPPYASCQGDCVPNIEGLGYHVVNFDIDTLDWQNKDLAEQMQVSIDNFNSAVDNGGQDSSFLVLSHDVHENTVEVLVPQMLQTIKKNGYRAVTVGECLGDARSNWYRSI
ncbi:chitin deacetylase [Podospora fimiseda]|uniref:Chitin deacetylase n=1 Tax=Podospora fimiseda TaxID=252190 RepID=A0AAN7BZR5_9PEZI|nr:chitin deacetylase [Podospora fimiseda]